MLPALPVQGEWILVILLSHFVIWTFWVHPYLLKFWGGTWWEKSWDAPGSTLVVFRGVSWRPLRWWSVNSSTPLLARTSNTGGNTWPETMLKSTSDGWTNESLHQVHLCEPLCWKKVFINHSALLQHSCSTNLPLSFSSALPYLPFTPFHSISLRRSQRGHWTWSWPKEL